MKWTRITKESLPPIDDYEDYPKKYLVRVKGDDPRSGWVYVKYETAAEMQDLPQEDYAEYLDESPESSVWPGEITSNILWNKYRSKNKIDGKFRMDVDHFHNAIDELKESFKSRTAGVPEIAFPDMKCTCIGEVLQKWGITPLAELVDEIEDVMWSRTVGEEKEKWDDSASLEDQIWALKVINNLLKNELLKQSRTAPDQPEQEEYQVQYEDGSWSREVRTRDKQPEQFSREDMFNAANEYAIVSLDSGIGHADFDKWITEYIKNKK